MRLVDADKLPWVDRVILVDQVDGDINITIAKEHTSYVNDETPTVEAIPVWYIIKWYKKRYKLGSTVADDWERGLLKEKIVKMHDDFKNKKFLDNKQESERFAQMVKEVIELYNDWEKENETD